VTVSAGVADFTSSNLALLDSDNNVFEEYDGDKFVHDLKTYSELKLVLKDIHGNL